ncbi:MAG: DNA polymerase III subunit gamma/tau [Coriobacteriales bacterium]|jgi:DNA polymerase-3 subunit gamma/tau|nr:DNA polymerase III subunit gamma/tau [Coriobacteriales bacterium]
MAISLYNKYRPKTFSDVVGQDHVERTLMNAVSSGNVASAYLLFGPRGTGKTTTARLLAKALLCEKAPTDDPDGTCAHCIDIAEGTHPDVFELDAASRTGVDNIREEIISRVKFAPTRGAYKLYIIDEVHMLSRAAFDALLLTLEEPPPHIVFILCTTDAHRVPDTIVSRCQSFDFRPLSDEQITGRLSEICTQEGFTAEPGALELIASRSGGGMRNAIVSLEQVAVFSGGSLTFSAVETLLGQVTSDQLFSLAELVAARDAAGCFAWVAGFQASGTDVAPFVSAFALHVRNLYVAAAVRDSSKIAGILSGDEETVEQYRRQAALFGVSSARAEGDDTSATPLAADRLAHLLTVLGDLSNELKSASNARLALEIALTRMVRPQSDLTIEGLAARVAALEQQVRLGGASVSPDASTGASPVPASVTSVPDSPLAASVVTDVEPLVAEAALSPQSTSVPNEDTTPSTAPPAEPTAPHSSEVPLDAAGVQRLWRQVAAEAREKKRFVALMISDTLAALDEGLTTLTVELRPDASYTKSSLELPDNARLLHELVERFFGRPLAIRYALGNEAMPHPQPTGIDQSPAEEEHQPSPAAQEPPEVLQQAEAPSVEEEPVSSEAQEDGDDFKLNIVQIDEKMPTSAERAATEARKKAALENILGGSLGSTVRFEEV